MTQLKEIMTRHVDVISADATAEDASTKMKQLNVGAIPVCDGNRLIGMVTDRDLVVRVMADRRDPKAILVQEAMTPDVSYCFEDDEVEQAARMMAERQIRRLPVRRATTSGPQPVSIATGIGSSGVSPYSASRSSSRRLPGASSLMRRLASRAPLSSTRATSWWRSAKSIPSTRSPRCCCLRR